MKLKNKKTGEVVERIDLVIREEGVVFNTDEQYNSLAELNDEWEDYEEKDGFWFIAVDGTVLHHNIINDGVIGETEKDSKEIGNYFETKEEAEQTVEKLKAWKRLKDLGFRFKGNDVIDDNLVIKYDFSNKDADLEICLRALQDVILLFGDEE